VQINEKHFDGERYLEEVVISKCSMKCCVGRPHCCRSSSWMGAVWLRSMALPSAFCVFSSPVLQMSSPDSKGPYFNILYLCRSEGKMAQAAVRNRSHISNDAFMLSSSQAQVNLACKPCSPWPMSCNLAVGSGNSPLGDFALLFLSCKLACWYLRHPAADPEGFGVEGAEGCDDV